MRVLGEGGGDKVKKKFTGEVFFNELGIEPVKESCRLEKTFLI